MKHVMFWIATFIALAVICYMTSSAMLAVAGAYTIGEFMFKMVFSTASFGCCLLVIFKSQDKK